MTDNYIYNISTATVVCDNCLLASVISDCDFLF